jgi:hypothetical protein
MSEKVQKVGLEREPGYLYFIDKQGDVARTLMSRGGKASKVKKNGVKDKTRKTSKKAVKKSAGKGKKK